MGYRVNDHHKEIYNMNTKYFIVLAPGHYGDTTPVISSHRSIAAARRAVQRVSNAWIREGYKRKGDLFLRVSEQIYPRVL